MSMDHRSLTELFAEQVKKTPDALAVLQVRENGMEQRISYAELDRRSDILARLLVQRGLRREEFVGVYTSRGISTYVALLALWKAGGAYLPLETSCPLPHLELLCQDAAPRIILSESSLQAPAQSLGRNVLAVDELPAITDPLPAEEPLPGCLPDQRALLLYTSGSTGQPKGVQHRQWQLLNRFTWLWNRYSFAQDAVMCQRAPLNFQPSLWELLGGLLRGIPTVVLPDLMVRDPRRFASRLQHHKITHLNIVPSLLRMLLDRGGETSAQLQGLRFVIAAGEPLTLDLVQKLRQQAEQAHILCDYGSTETNGVLYFDLEPHRDVTALPGFRPIDNIHAYVLNDARQRPAPGETGELCIGGGCLMLGYHQRPGLSAELTLPNPYDEPAAPTLFRTGDCALIADDGTISLVGRQDEQVKIRGNRVELRAIEEALRQTAPLGACKVVAQQHLGHLRLVAFLSPQEGTQLAPAKLREELAARLPSYMVPSLFHVEAKLPQLPNGKLDVQALLARLKQEDAPAEDGACLERLIAHASRVLGLPKAALSAKARFYELGFDSASIAELAVALERDGFPVTVSELYSYPTLTELSQWLGSLGAAEDPRAPLPPALQPAESPQCETGDAPPAPELRLEIGTERVIPSNFRAAPHARAERATLRNLAETRQQPIAIISCAGRFPGCSDVDSLWQALSQGRDCVSLAPTERFADAHELSPRFRGGFLSGVEDFDPAFFDISPREAKLMDPQQRLALEECWNALERAGYSPASLSGRQVAVFFGARPGDYAVHAGQLGSAVTGFGLMGADQAILAARIAYHLNLKGAALTVDTACSSSLLAVHLACQSLALGECEMALAGGVHVMSSTQLYRASAELGMLSAQGRCMTFDEQADGIVPSEAVGVVLLKPLAAAQHDRDPILGVILGSAANQDGKTNGITAPNARAQEQLLTRLYERLALNPETLGYVEAHGTGTKQGDPIELQALSRSFRRFTARQRFCAIGSIKSNLGHPIAAAGIVGLIKTLLVLRHGRIPGSVHYRKANPGLALDDSPFFVNAQPIDWPADRDTPRRAAVSSFGFSGTNCHLIVEGPPPASQPSRSPGLSGPFLFPISAKSETALRNTTARLLQFLREPQEPGALSDIAYTLQSGRGHFPIRICPIAHTLDELADQLAASTAVLPAPASDWPSAQAELRALYLRGDDVDWAAENAGQKVGRRLVLPSYGFDRQRCWVDSPSVDKNLTTPWFEMDLLPRSTGTELTVQVRVPGRSFVFTDHRVGQNGVLPAAAYLELARAAASQYLSTAIRGLSDIVWLRPLFSPGSMPAEGSAEMKLTLQPDSQGVRFAFLPAAADSGACYCQGRLLTAQQESDEELWASSELRDAQRAATVETLDSPACYARLQALQLEYGPAFRTLQRLRCGLEQAVAEYALPSAASSTPEGELPPALLDGIFQSVIGLAPTATHREALLPFELSHFAWRAPLPKKGFVVVRKNASGSVAAPSAELRIFDLAGRAVGRIQGFVRKAAKRIEPPAKPPCITLFEKVWHGTPQSDAPPAPSGRGPLWILDQTHGSWPQLESQLALLTEQVREVTILRHPSQAELAQHLQIHGAPPRIALLLPEPDQRPEFARASVLGVMLLETVQGLLAKSAAAPIQFLLCYRDHGPQTAPALTAAAAFARAICRETTRLELRAVAMRSEGDAALPEILGLELEMPQGLCAEVRYVAGARQVAQMTRASSPRLSANRLKRGGCYLITGGLGGLGNAVARYLARAHAARIVLLGRSEPSKASRLIADLRDLGGQASYLTCDISEAAQVREAVRTVRAVHGRIDGVIHCAGVRKDRRAAQATREEAVAVLRPKADGAHNLDAALSDEPLAFFVVFSSLAGVLGAAGQSVYAYANGILDAFAAQRAEKVRQCLRHGHTLSLAWPYWSEGGMRVDSSTLERWRDELGLEPLPSDVGCQVFEQALTREETCLAVFYGEAAKLERHMQHEAAALRPLPSSQELAAPARPPVQQWLEAEIKKCVAAVVGLKETALKVDRELQDYGFESMLLGELAAKLRQLLGVSLSPSLFFDYRTITAIADHLQNVHGEALESACSVPQVAPAPIDATPSRQEPASTPQLSAEVSILGLAARFPGANNEEELFALLRSGRRVVKPLPAQRHLSAPTESPPIAALLDDVDGFDASFFGISPAEARLMDPQQRLLLETTWAALENAGLRPSDLRGSRTGIFVGVFANDHATAVRKYVPQDDPHLLTASSHAMLANRLSHYFDWVGPSEAIDTACSSSLVALHRAVQALRAGECETALVAGVHLLLSEEGFAPAARAGLLSSTGTARPFSAQANGYVRGEGVGAVVLRRTADARRDGNPIRAMILGTAVGHHGRSFALTAPSALGQKRVLLDAVAAAGIDARTISYIEAHGAGAPMSDATELRALAESLLELGIKPEAPAVRIGSSKGHIGHLEAASGIASLIKTVLCLEQRLLPGLPENSGGPEGLETPAPLRIVARTEPWLAPAPLRAGVHSYGLGGTIAHVILGESPPASQAAMETDETPQLLVFSAKNPTALLNHIRNVATRLATEPRLKLRDIALTLAQGRESFQERAAVLADSLEQAVRRLSQFSELRAPAAGCFSSAAPDAEPNLDIETALATGELQALASWWCRGNDIAWNQLPTLRGAQKISLPTYSFSRSPHRLSEPQAAVSLQPEDGIENRLQALVAESLGVPCAAVDAQASLQELGLESLMALKLRQRIVAEFAIELPTSQLLKCATFGALLRLVTENKAPSPSELVARFLAGEVRIDDLPNDQVELLYSQLL